MSQQLIQGIELHPFEKLIKLFFLLDKNNDGFVSRSELIEYYDKNGLEKRNVEEFMNRFDAYNDNKISMDEYCRVFGFYLHEAQMEKKDLKVQQARETSGSLPSFDDVEILNSSMTWEKQEDIVNKYKELVGGGDASNERMNDAVQDLQTYLNRTYGRTWQCIILNGSYWIRYNHDPFYSLQFKHGGKNVVLVWRINRR
ncbi:hypothetical protein CRM22_004069 [Opisthorchis felineus]|uniref:EF-hand domain-containing protein n=2 Tax=Opisthorchis felineus TaxID=147828 RepID=A0A4V3SFK5_OPIFE|nr:hypothetical protein CRM22_004069 [Opisthorchis felineus]